MRGNLLARRARGSTGRTLETVLVYVGGARATDSFQTTTMRLLLRLRLVRRRRQLHQEAGRPAIRRRLRHLREPRRLATKIRTAIRRTGKGRSTRQHQTETAAIPVHINSYVYLTMMTTMTLQPGALLMQPERYGPSSPKTYS